MTTQLTLRRGIDPSKLINSSLWWSGPQWLTSENFPKLFPPQDTSEKRKQCAEKMQIQQSNDHRSDVINLREQNSLRETLRIVVQIRQLNDKCKGKKTNCSNISTPTEMQEASEISLHQETYKLFSSENETL